ncbi:toll-like receptor 2 [Glandiceps talaboti]
MDLFLKISVLVTLVSCIVYFDTTSGSRHVPCVKAVNVTCPKNCICEYCHFVKGRRTAYGLRVMASKSDSNPYGISSVPENIPPETYRLYLGNNKISKLNSGAFSHLKSAKSLCLKYNSLISDQVHPNAFEGLEKLEDLDLSYQRGLHNIPSDLFKPLRRLRNVRLEKVNLVNIAEDAFRYNTLLINIILNGNRLEYIPPSLFHNLPYLRRVMLQYNHLYVLPQHMFDGSRKITDLQLANCELSSIAENVGLHNLTNMEKLHLYGNKFNCGCELRWFRNWIGSVKFIYKINDTKCSSGQTILQFNPDKLQCEFPTVMVACVSVFGVILVCAVISLLVNYRWKIRYVIFLIQHRVKRYQPIPGNNQLYKYDAFVSHSYKDQDWILQVLRPKLETPPHNFKLCLDFRDFAVGSLIADNIMNAIEESRKTIFILTQQFIDSEWCYFELEMVRQKMFDEHRDAAILVLKDDIPAKKMPGLLKYFMRNGKYIKWSEHEGGQKLFWKQLDSALKCSNVNMI